MSQSFGTLASAVVLQRALDLVNVKRPILGAISWDASDEACAYGQQIITHKLGVPTVEDFGTGAKDQADVDVPVTLNKFKEIHIALTPQEYSGTNRQLLNERSEAIALAIANHMVDAVAALWTATNFTNSTAVSNSWDYDSVLMPIRSAMAGRGVPESGRFLVANSTVYSSILADSMIVSTMNNPANAEAIRTGQLPEVAGFKIAEYPGLPSNSEYLIGFAGTRDAVIIASRVPRNPADLLNGAAFPGNLQVVKNAATGLSIMVNEWVDPATLTANLRLIWMYGLAIGNANNAQRLVSQAS